MVKGVGSSGAHVSVPSNHGAAGPSHVQETRNGRTAGPVRHQNKY